MATTIDTDQQPEIEASTGTVPSANAWDSRTVTTLPSRFTKDAYSVDVTRWSSGRWALEFKTFGLSAEMSDLTRADIEAVRDALNALLVLDEHEVA